jgi:hypothetical protein
MTNIISNSIGQENKIAIKNNSPYSQSTNGFCQINLANNTYLTQNTILEANVTDLTGSMANILTVELIITNLTMGLPGTNLTKINLVKQPSSNWTTTINIVSPRWIQGDYVFIVNGTDNLARSYITTALIKISDSPILNILAPKNNTYVTGMNGPVTIMIEVISPGIATSLTNNLEMNINGTWVEMINATPVGSVVGQYAYFLNMSTANGSFEFPIRASNLRGFTTQIFLNFTIDNEDPQFSYLDGLVNDKYLLEDTTIRVNVTDQKSNVSSVKLTISEDFGSKIQYQTVDLANSTNTPEIWEYLFLVKSNNWTEGRYKLQFDFRDNAGNIITNILYLKIDYTPPELIILDPANNSMISGEYKIRISARDTTSGINQVQISTEIASSILTTPVQGNIYEYLLNTTATTLNAITLNVSIQNGAGVSVVKNYNLRIDNIAPTLIFIGETLIENNRTVLSDSKLFNLTCSDDQNLARIAWCLEGELYTNLPLISSQNFTFNSTMYADGDYNLMMLVEDEASPANRVILKIPIRIDNTDPQVRVTNLRKNDRVAYNYVVEIEILDATTCQLYISIDNGQYILLNKTANQQNWTLDLSTLGLTAGSHYIVFRGVDAAGNIDDDAYLFVLNEEPWLKPWMIYTMAGVGVGLIGVAGGLIYKKKHSVKPGTKKDAVKKPKEKAMKAAKPKVEKSKPNIEKVKQKTVTSSKPQETAIENKEKVNEASKAVSNTPDKKDEKKKK